jgi:hypothetical protein
LAWRVQADACESEMTARSIDFVAIDWREPPDLKCAG